MKLDAHRQRVMDDYSLVIKEYTDEELKSEEVRKAVAEHRIKLLEDEVKNLQKLLELSAKVRRFSVRAG